MKISIQGEKKLNELIKEAESNYTKAAILTAKYGFDQDGRGMGVYYRDQLRAEAVLNELKKIKNKAELFVGPKSGFVDIGSRVLLEINGESKEFFIDGFRYENTPPVLTPDTPLGKKLLGKKKGAEINYSVTNKSHEVKVKILKIK